MCGFNLHFIHDSRSRWIKQNVLIFSSWTGENLYYLYYSKQGLNWQLMNIPYVFVNNCRNPKAKIETLLKIFPYNTTRRIEYIAVTVAVWLAHGVINHANAGSSPILAWHVFNYFFSMLINTGGKIRHV